MPGTLPLSAFWFLYMSAMGIFFPFFALYLRENAGLDGTRAGVVYAMIPLVGLFAPTLWGRLADRSDYRPGILALAVAGAGIGYGLLALLGNFALLVIGTAALAVFATAVIPLGVSVSLAALGAEGHYTFGRVRVWGTVGYLLLVVTFPWLLDAFQGLRGLRQDPGGPSEPGLELMFYAAMVLAVAAAVVTARVPSAAELPATSEPTDWRGLLRHPPFLRMLLFAFLAYLFLQGPMNLFPSYVRARGGGLDAVSHMWIVMLVPEIPLVALSGPSLRRLGPRGLLALGVVAGGLRWAVCGASDDLRVVYVLQLLHGPLVAGLLIGGPLYVDAVVPPRLRSTAQGLLAMAGVGFGGIASSLATGWLMDRFGTGTPYLLGGVGALLLGIGTALVLPHPARSVSSIDRGGGISRRSLPREVKP